MYCRELTGRCHQITTMSVQHLATYRTAVDNSSEALHAAVGRMTEFVHKCSQLNEEMKAVNDIVVKVYGFDFSLSETGSNGLFWVSTGRRSKRLWMCWRKPPIGCKR
jgi:hypothetical protein